MSAAVSLLLAALKWLLLLLLALLVLLLAALCVPVAVQIDYRQQALALTARYGPLHLKLYPRPRPAGKAKPKAKRPRSAAASKPKPAPAAKPEGSTVGAAAQGGPMQALLDAARQDPLGMLEAVLAHIGFAGGCLLRGVHVRGLDVFWTVTDARLDAAATALLYGRELAVLNALLAAARRHMDIRADALWLEPDFTGERRAERFIAGCVTLRPIVVVLLAPRLLFRIWRDPAFQSFFVPQKRPAA